MKDFLEILKQPLFEIGKFKVDAYIILYLIIIIAITNLILYVLRKIIKKAGSMKHADPGRQHSFTLLVTYFIWVIAISLILETIGIKITILLAGSAALMVGLGLGLQSTFNDIVSGIILLFEGSIRVNDVMEVDGIVGRVTEINLRTSKLLTREGIIMIVPNHKFINENVINWTHNLDATRFTVTVGVAYGSDVEKVKAILLKCAEGHEHIKQDDDKHQIIVRFKDFGDSALNFELMFWSLHIFGIENVKSDLRYRIDAAFRKEKITIPFPQRVVHQFQQE
jgi:small-conductance mechanosensitive channel